MLISVYPSNALDMLDLPVALMMLASGIFFVFYAKKNRAHIQKKVESGEYTEAAGKTKDKTVRLCGYALVLIGVGLTASWYFR